MLCLMMAKKIGEIVSVVIPTYNRRNLVDEAIESVLRQKYSLLEVIVVDDGSTDETVPFLTEKYGRDVEIVRCDHKGVSYARNLGIKKSSGDYVCFLDSDDLLPNSSIGDRVNILRDLNKVSIFYSARINFGKGFVDNLNLGSFPSGNVISDYISNSELIPLGGLMISKFCLDNVGGFNENLSHYEDKEFMLRLMSKFSFVFSGKVGYFVRNIASNRLRNDHQSFLKEGTVFLDYVFKDACDEVLKNKSELMGDHFLELARSAWILGKGDLFRNYYKMARVESGNNKFNLKFWRRYLLSFLKVNKSQ